MGLLMGLLIYFDPPSKLENRDWEVGLVIWLLTPPAPQEVATNLPLRQHLQPHWRGAEALLPQPAAPGPS